MRVSSWFLPLPRLEIQNAPYRTECRSFAILGVTGSAEMRDIPKADLLEALKQSLRDLDNVKILSPNDLEVLNLRRTLKEQIAAIERQMSQR
jgi:hypothetical protein